MGGHRGLRRGHAPLPLGASRHVERRAESRHDQQVLPDNRSGQFPAVPSAVGGCRRGRGGSEGADRQHRRQDHPPGQQDERGRAPRARGQRVGQRQGAGVAGGQGQAGERDTGHTKAAGQAGHRGRRGHHRRHRHPDGNSGEDRGEEGRLHTQCEGEPANPARRCGEVLRQSSGT